ncbi:MAG: polysaccharide biosynthesis tyrosine autokinase [Pedosphaera sp.]|nr:polysaccharide biosynthesis tyrosine autokinase [Pedosphaera sp.]
MDPLKVPQTPETRLHFLDYWRIIRIRKTVILAVFLLVVITATLVTFILPESFSSVCRIKIERDLTDIDGLAGSRSIGAYDPYFIQTEFETIQSEVILGKVIDNLKLNEVWGKKYGTGGPLKNIETIGLLKGRMDLRPVRSTSLVEIRFYSEDKDEASQLANAIADAYRDHRQSERLRLLGGGIKALEERFTEQSDKITAAQKDVDGLREKLNISEADASATASTPLLEVDSLRRIMGQLIEAKARLTEIQVSVEGLAGLSRAELRQVLPRTRTDASLTELLSQQNIAEQQFLRLKVDFSPDHPQYVSLDAQLKDLELKIEGSVNGIMKALSNQVSAAQAGVGALQKAVDDAKKRDIETAQLSRPYFEAKRKLEELNRFGSILGMKLASERIDLSLPRTTTVEIIDKATPGSRPVRPNKPLNIALGIIIGLVVGVGLAFFIEYLDTSVKTIDDVERSLQSPVLGVIPQNVGLLFDEGAESPHAEAYRVLRTNLLFSRKDDKLNSVAVVSAGAGEGKSTTVMNLATVFAQSGQRVVIVDSDLRRPTLHKMLHVTNNLGLTNYLLKQNTLEEVIQTTSLPSLDFLASGKLPSSSLGILSSAQMKDLINDLKQRYDFVFFDSPPIMGVSDASILASEVDITLQVIQYRRYPQPMNIRAKQLIEKVGGNLVGIVLNNINMSQDESYYYYSGYYHDYYSKNEESEVVKPAGKDSGDKGKTEIKQKY